MKTTKPYKNVLKINFTILSQLIFKKILKFQNVLNNKHNNKYSN